MIDSSKNTPRPEVYNVNECSATSGINSVIDSLGLEHNQFVRLGPDNISAFEGCIDCLGEGGIGTMFNTKYGTSGDCYLALVETQCGNTALILDCVREDKIKKTQTLCFDQDPIFIKQCENGEWALSGCKISHGNWQGRTVDCPSYAQYSSAFVIDTPYQISELEKKAPEIYKAFPFTEDYVDGLEEIEPT